MYKDFNPKIVFRYGLIFIVIASLGIIWSSIRQDYRAILNRGTGRQEVLISPQERITAFFNLASFINKASIEQALEFSIYRVSYTDIFGQVLDRVPAYTSYENGFILQNTVKHVSLLGLFSQ